MNEEHDAWIVRAMSKPSFYDHPVTDVEVIETHISWVFLAGHFAYKVKKPVNLGFLDFSTLAQRHQYCREELLFNRGFSSPIYLSLTQIGGSRIAPVINGEPPLEYAVKMRRFPQECQLDRMLDAGRLQESHILAFADLLASLHMSAEYADSLTHYGNPEVAIEPILENFRQIRPHVTSGTINCQLDRLEEWSRMIFESLSTIISQRKADGLVRACHGDVHLANMAWLDDSPVLFDCIEFNDDLRWIDVINDVAFLVMDLDDRDQAALGWSFLNRYLQETGDYPGLVLINLYKCYRAMVRAKVACLRLAQGHLDDRERPRVEQLFQSYLDLAGFYTHTFAPTLMITHGLSGAGKSTFSAQLANAIGAIHLRSDLERKRLFGLAANEKSCSPIDGGIYSTEAFAKTYQRMFELAGQILSSGVTVIVDATFIRQHQRDLFRKLADDLQVPFHILDFTVPEEELRCRITQRADADVSEATLDVLTYQLAHAEPLTSIEKQESLIVHAGTTVGDIVAALRRMVK